MQKERKKLKEINSPKYLQGRNWLRFFYGYFLLVSKERVQLGNLVVLTSKMPTTNNFLIF